MNRVKMLRSQMARSSFGARQKSDGFSSGFRSPSRTGAQQESEEAIMTNHKTGCGCKKCKKKCGNCGKKGCKKCGPCPPGHSHGSSSSSSSSSSSGSHGGGSGGHSQKGCGACNGCDDSCGCPDAFDESFVREFLATQSIPGDAKAFAAFFAPEGCIEFNFEQDFRTCTPAEIEALFEFLPTVIDTLEFELLSIDRIVQPDCSVTILLHINTTETTSEGVRKIHEHWVLQVNPECEVTLFQFFQLLESTTPPEETSFAASRSAAAPRRLNRLQRGLAARR